MEDEGTNVILQHWVVFGLPVGNGEEDLIRGRYTGNRPEECQTEEITAHPFHKIKR